MTLFWCTTDQVRLSSLCVNFWRSYASLWTSNIGNMQFSALFSYMLWHIELKFCIWLCFIVLQIKFECRQFASMFVGVMPPLELRILEIHSFPHFSHACFDMLSWNFAYDFVLSYYRSRLSVINLRQCLLELCPFWNLEYWKYTVFRTFLLHALTYWAEILHMILFHLTTYQVRVLSICINFLRAMPLLELKMMKYTVFRTFLLHALTYRAEILHMTFFNCTTDQVRVSSIRNNFCTSNAPFGP